MAIASSSSSKSGKAAATMRMTGSMTVAMAMGITTRLILSRSDALCTEDVVKAGSAVGSRMNPVLNCLKHVPVHLVVHVS